MSADAKVESSPAKRGRPAAVKTKLPDEGELAAALFIKLYTAGGGRTARHYAESAIEAAEVFMEAYTKGINP